MVYQLVLVGRQCGKQILTGNWSGKDILAALRSGEVIVNPYAQRTLAAGSDRTPTQQLLEDDRVHRTPRIRELVKFLRRVMDKIENEDVTEGFLGAVLMVIPENFENASLTFPEFSSGALRLNSRPGILSTDPDVGEHAFHIGDGQGRFFALYSLERCSQEVIQKLKRNIKRNEKKGLSTEEDQQLLEKEEEMLKRVRKFINQLEIPVICYVREIKEDGVVVGLDQDAEKRLYIEGNALNNNASKEDQYKFDCVGPVSVALEELRLDENVGWMRDEHIEADSKSIAKSSSKLFTRSTLTQAYALSTINTPKAITVSPEAYTEVGCHQEFAKEYWKKITEVFSSLWLAPAMTSDSASERLRYLVKLRQEQNVAIQAVFLQALGMLGYRLGELAEWDRESEILNRLDALKPKTDDRPDGQDYRAFVGSFNESGEQIVNDAQHDFNLRWSHTLMKPKTKGDKVIGYSFDNVRGSITKTFQYLSELIGIDASATEESPE